MILDILWKISIYISFIVLFLYLLNYIVHKIKDYYPKSKI